MKTDLILQEKAIQKYELTPEAVAKMAEDYLKIEVIFDDKESYGVARDAKTRCVKARTGTEERRKDLTKEARQWQTDVNQAAKDLLAPLVPVEEHLKAELKKEDDRKEAILEEKRNKEIKRIATIQEKIEDIRRKAENLTNMSSGTLSALVESVQNTEISLEEFQEFAQHAKTAKEAAIITIEKAHAAQIQQEQADEARKVENERLERIRLEQEAKAAELKEYEDKIIAERKAEQEKIDIEKAVVRAEQAEIEASKKAEQERIDREKFKAQAKEAARIQAEKDAKEKAEREERERVKKEQAEVEEKARREALKPDVEKLLAYGQRLVDVKVPAMIDKATLALLAETYNQVKDIHRELKRSIEDL